MFSILDIQEVRFDLLDIPMQLDALEFYILHLESHNEWPRRVEEQRANTHLDDQQRNSILDEIEYKYSVVLPLRQRFSYVTQLTTLIEWAAKKILVANNTKSKTNVAFNSLLYLLSNELCINICNREQLQDLYKLRCKIVHENGAVKPADIAEWEENKFCRIQKVLDEFYLFIEMHYLLKCFSETRGWILEATSQKMKNE